MFQILLLVVALFWTLFLVVKSADLAIKYATRLAESFRLPRYLIGFLVVAVIAILPETFIFINSAVEGIPSFGLGTIFGSNTADLSLIFALVILISGKNLKVESKIIKNRFVYIAVMSLPILLGLDGMYSQADGLGLVIVGLLFYIYLLRDSRIDVSVDKREFQPLYFVFLVLSMAGLLVGTNLTVKFGVNLANLLGISPILVGLFVVGLGTTLPELFFSIRAAKNNHDSLALGDILGTVVADATVVIGIVALLHPFTFNPRLIFVTGLFMLTAIIFLMYYMRTGRVLTKKEAYLLLIFYAIFVISELLTANL